MISGGMNFCIEKIDKNFVGLFLCRLKIVYKREVQCILSTLCLENLNAKK